MNEYLTYLLIGVGVLLVALLVPGVKVLAEALLSGFFAFMREFTKHLSTFLVWTIKTLSGDHMRVLRHALVKRDELDPTQRIRRKAEGYED